MAWNPSPIVQVARDAARSIEKVDRTNVNQVIVIYITDAGQLGTISYGKDRQQCVDAKVLGDKLYERVMEIFTDYQG